MLRKFNKRPMQSSSQSTNKKPQFTNANSTSTVLFSNGSSLDWQRSREKLVNKFKEEGCWTLVEVPTDMVPEPNPLINQLLLVEVLFNEVEPSRNTIEEKLVQYDQECETLHAENVALINAAGLTASDRAKQLLANNQDFSKRKFNRKQVGEDLEKIFLNQVSLYESKKREHERKVASCIKVFTNYIGPSALSVVKTHLEQNKFRRSWYELDKHYSADSGGRQTRTTVYNILNNLSFEGRNFTNHLKNFNDLVDQSISLGHTIDSDMRFQLLSDSIKRGNNRDYDKTLEYSELQGISYPEFVSKLQTRSSQLLLESSTSPKVAQVTPEKANNVDFATLLSTKAGRKFIAAAMKEATSSNSNSNNNSNVNKNSVTVKCELCSRVGHNQKSCWGNNKCPTCGVLDKNHNPYACAKSQKANSVNDGEGSTTTSKKNGRKVSLANEFQQAHPSTT